MRSKSVACHSVAGSNLHSMISNCSNMTYQLKDAPHFGKQVCIAISSVLLSALRDMRCFWLSSTLQRRRCHSRKPSQINVNQCGRETTASSPLTIDSGTSTRQGNRMARRWPGIQCFPLCLRLIRMAHAPAPHGKVNSVSCWAVQLSKPVRASLKPQDASTHSAAPFWQSVSLATPLTLLRVPELVVCGLAVPSPQQQVAASERRIGSRRSCHTAAP